MTYILRYAIPGTHKVPPYKMISSPSSRRSIQSSYSVGNLGSSVDQAEDVVEHEEATGTVGLEREELSIVHGLLLLIDLIAPNLLECRT